MDFYKINIVYFLGIGGIGMSALARYFKKSGKVVSGYDKTPSPLTDQLINEGIEVHFADNPKLLPANVDLVILTPAIPKNHKELLFFLEANIPILKRSEVLGLISRNKQTIAVAGTHGKTSVSTLTAHLFHDNSKQCSAFLGGISKNYKTNFLWSETSDLIVVEADEFDRSFLTLFPQLAVITSMDADHLDIYREKRNLELSFQQFVDQILPGGALVLKKELVNNVKVKDNIRLFTYSIQEKADFCIEKMNFKNGLYYFTLITPFGVIKEIKLGIPGLFNVENAVAAAALALLSGLSINELIKGMASFAGIQRRFDIRINRPDLVYIDDYAHHPVELKACISAVREMFPGKKITGIFQPHLYSRTRDFADEFARSLELLDEIILLEIYPAREKPIPGITSAWLLEKICGKQKQICSKVELLNSLNNHSFDILLTLGAGDIDQLVATIENTLEQ